MNACPPQPWLDTLVADAASEQRRLAVLVDPQDAPSGSDWRRLVSHIQSSEATDIFVGGSLVTNGSTQRVVHVGCPVEVRPVDSDTHLS